MGPVCFQYDFCISLLHRENDEAEFQVKSIIASKHLPAIPNHMVDKFSPRKFAVVINLGMVCAMY